MPNGSNEGRLQLPKPCLNQYCERDIGGAHSFGGIYMSYTKELQKILDRELQHDRIVDDELTETLQESYIDDVIHQIEDMRKKRLAALKKSNALGGFPKDYNQKQFAESVGISYSTYKNYLTGHGGNISLKTLLKIASKLQCNLDEILKSVRLEQEKNYME